MTWQYDGFNWIVRLEKGELLIQTLTRFINEQKIPSCWISGIGGAAWAELGFYDLQKQRYLWQKLNKGLEIINLQGNIAWEKERVIIHTHGVFSDSTMQVQGGHVKELEVTGTAEIYLHKWYQENWQRTLNPDTGLKQLDI